MGFDIVTNWTPSVTPGAANDDAYNLPGCVKLDGSAAAAGEADIEVGPSNIYSSVPTIPEINSGYGANQVIAAIRRRAQLFNTYFDGGASVPAYLTSDSIDTLASTFTSIFNSINGLRAKEGLSAYTFPTSDVASDKDAVGVAIAHMRKALRISGIWTKEMATPMSGTNIGTEYGVVDGMQFSMFSRRDDPYPDATPEFEVLLHNYDGSRLFGKDTTNFAGSPLASAKVHRWRTLLQFPVPEWLTSADSAEFRFTLNNSETFTDLEGWTGIVYTSNIDDSAIAPAVAYNTNNNEGTFASSVVGEQTLSLPVARITGRSAGRLCFIIGTTNEIAGAGVGWSSNKGAFGSLSNAKLVANLGA